MTSLLTEFWAAQMVGVIALICAVIALQSKTRPHILFGQLLAALLFAVHFLMLAAYTGVAMNLLVVGRNIAFSQKNKKRIWLYTFIVGVLVLGALSWQGWISIFPIVAMVLGTCALWQERPKTIRLLLLTSGTFWFPYLILSHSYSGILGQSIAATAILFGMLRHDRKL